MRRPRGVISITSCLWCTVCFEGLWIRPIRKHRTNDDLRPSWSSFDYDGRSKGFLTCLRWHRFMIIDRKRRSSDDGKKRGGRKNKNESFNLPRSRGNWATEDFLEATESFLREWEILLSSSDKCTLGDWEIYMKMILDWISLSEQSLRFSFIVIKEWILIWKSV